MQYFMKILMLIQKGNLVFGAKYYSYVIFLLCKIPYSREIKLPSLNVLLFAPL